MKEISTEFQEVLARQKARGSEQSSDPIWLKQIERQNKEQTIQIWLSLHYRVVLRSIDRHFLRRHLSIWWIAEQYIHAASILAESSQRICTRDVESRFHASADYVRI